MTIKEAANEVRAPEATERAAQRVDEQYQAARATLSPEALSRALQLAPLLEHVREQSAAHFDCGLALHYGGSGGGALILQLPEHPGGPTEIDLVTNGMPVGTGFRIVAGR